MKWLIDEMLPAATAEELNALGHDAVSVHDAALTETPDDVVYAVAVEQERVLVTENFADFARLLELRVASGEPCVPVVFVRKRNFPRGGGLARHLAAHLHKWAMDDEDPYPGVHRP